MKRTILTILAALAITSATAQSAEFGVQYDHRGPAVFSYLTADFDLGSLGPVDFWFSPSIEVIVAQTYIDGWVQGQFLVDTSFATLSARARAELIDTRTRYEFRIGVLIGR